VRQQRAVRDQVVRRGLRHHGLDDVAGPDPVGCREVDQPAVAGPAGQSPRARVLAALPRRDQQLDLPPTWRRFSAQLISSCSAVSRR
jgi:hypothetical protein